MDLATPRIDPRTLNVSHGDDSGLFVEFFMESVHLEAKSEEEGRPIYEDRPYIKIMFPGDRTKQIVRPVKMESDTSPSDPLRFPRQWEAFRAQKEQVQEGTPLEQWAPISKSQALELKGVHIHTVEQLAALADNALTWLGARELRDKAAAWLKQANGGKEVVRLTKENALLREELDAVKAQMKDLAETVSQKQKAAA